MKNEYTIGKVTFASAGRQWKFSWKRGRWGRTLLVDIRGKEKATKVANIINGAIKRGAKGGIDGMARENIKRLTPVVKVQNPIVY